jgi:anti-sigma factor RsiW
VLHDNPHLTIEQFSELINERLTPQERIQAEEHLQHCARCQEELIDLRRVVAMLRALPRPELPRSFALPADTKVAPLVAAARRPSRLRAAGRAISLLAAAVGIVLLVSSLINLPLGGGAATETSAGSSVSPQTRHAGIQPFTPSTSTNTPSLIEKHAAPQSQHTPSSAQSPLTLPDLRTAVARAVLGVFLLLIGLAWALILWRRRYSLP